MTRPPLIRHHMTRTEWAFADCNILLLVIIALTWRTFIGGILFGSIVCAFVVRYAINKRRPSNIVSDNLTSPSTKIYRSDAT